MFKKFKSIVIVSISLMLFAIVTPYAHAHVTVNPSSSEVNDYVKYGVRVPVEKDINTTELELIIPDEIDIISIEPEVEWDYDLEKNDSDQITSITWTENSGGIGPDEFIEFSFIGVNPDEAGEVSWEALQTYEDGSVVEWVDPPGSEEPASVTDVLEEGAADTSASTSSSSNGIDWLPIGIAAAAFILALIGLFRKRA